jgi:hypothetical protein
MLGKRRTMWALRLLVADGGVLVASFLIALRVVLNDRFPGRWATHLLPVASG